MISLPFRRPRRGANIDALYGMIVAQARSPSFYRGYGVPDVVEARIDMIMLHLVLVLRNLRAGGPMADKTGSVNQRNGSLAQMLFDHFCQDMDDNFREMGVGDLSVPKEMQRIAEAFYGRAKAYDTALDAGDMVALEAALARNIYGASASEPSARRLAIYARAAADVLEDQDLSRGSARFPDPEAVVPL